MIPTSSGNARSNVPGDGVNTVRRVTHVEFVWFKMYIQTYVSQAVRLTVSECSAMIPCIRMSGIPYCTRHNVDSVYSYVGHTVFYTS